MTHAFLADVAARLAKAGAATLRYNFPYMESRKNRVDSPDVATDAVRSAVSAAGELFPGVPLVAGGKSFGGRMTSQAQARAPLPGVRGLAFLGYPLHPPGKPGIERAEHLDHVDIPMLFLQGTRDEFAQLDLLRPVVARCRAAALILTNDGDHSFKVRKSSGLTQAQVMQSLVEDIVHWTNALPPS
jgi:hypothetical protein